MTRLLYERFAPRLMSDSEGAAAVTVTPTGATGPTTPAAITTPAPDAPRVFTQDEVDRLIGKTRDETRKIVIDDAKRQRDEDEAKAKGEWEKLATEREAENVRLKAEIADRDRKLLIAKVSARHHLPETLAARLIGTTEAELDEDAKTLAKEVGARKAPETEAGAGATRTSGPPGARPEAKKLDGPVYGFDGQPKVPWTRRDTTSQTT